MGDWVGYPAALSSLSKCFQGIIGNKGLKDKEEICFVLGVILMFEKF